MSSFEAKTREDSEDSEDSEDTVRRYGAKILTRAFAVNTFPPLVLFTVTLPSFSAAESTTWPSTILSYSCRQSLQYLAIYSMHIWQHLAYISTHIYEHKVNCR
jgi:hypothetical protein